MSKIGLKDGVGPFYRTKAVQWEAKIALAHNGIEFTAPAGSYSYLAPMAWAQKGAYSSEKSDTWSQKLAGSLTTYSFIISKTVFAFQAGYGGPHATVTLKTKGNDGTYTQRKQVKLDTQDIAEYFWDVSGLLNEVAVIEIKNSAGHRLYTNNFRLFDSAQGCMSDCMTIAPNRYTEGNLDIMGTEYEPVNKGTSYADENTALYCARDNTGLVSPGATPGGRFENAFPEGIEYHNLDVGQLPNCMMVHHLDRNTFQIAIEVGQRQFSYSNLYTPSSIVSDTLYCVYPTARPRCIEYSNIMSGLRQTDMFCAEAEPSRACMETVLALKCPLESDVPCGAKKTLRDIMQCCDQADNRASNGCIGHNRRRLGAVIRFETQYLEVVPAESCARACAKQPDEMGCVAWRLDDFDNSCRLASECYPASFAEVKNLELLNNRWNLLSADVNPFEGKKVLKLVKTQDKLEEVVEQEERDF